MKRRNIVDRKTLILLLVFLCHVTITGCVPATTTKQEAFPQMYAEKPKTILVLPPINETTAADAKEYYAVTIAEPLSYAGYYILPMEVTSDILKREGIYDSELIQPESLQKFKEYFGADAVMYITLKKWDTAYYVIGGHVTVAASLRLQSTKSGQELWRYDGQLVMDTSGGNSGGGIAGLISQLIVTAIKTAAQDYVPVAKRVSAATIATMPAGIYHAQHMKDGQQAIYLQTHMKKTEEKAE